jgi:glucose/arabinose dehydrogenase
MSTFAARLLPAFVIYSIAGIAPASALPPNFQMTTVWSGLNVPTSVRFAPNGKVFVAEKRGVIKVFDSISDTTPTILADFQVEVLDFLDRGLNALAVDPQFPTRPFVYAFFAVDAPVGQTPPFYHDVCPMNGTNCPSFSRLVRITVSGDTMAGRTTLMEGWCHIASTHSTADLVFGADGFLYVGHGEGGAASYVDYGQSFNTCGDPPNEGGAMHAQDLATSGDPLTYAGSLLRIDPDTGAAAPGNPLIGTGTDADDRVVAYGLRNPFRFAIDHTDGDRLWIADVGWNSWEEIDTLPDPPAGPVRNFGWPCYEGPVQNAGYQAANLPICDALYAAGTAHGPYHSYAHVTGSNAVTGIALYRGANFPAAYDGALFFADYARGFIKVMMPGPNGLPGTSSISDFIPSGVAPVDLQVASDGSLFFVDIVAGKVQRVRYFAENTPPTAKIDTSATYGPLPLTVNFSGASSFDPDPGDVLAYAWDLDGDGAFDDSTAVAPSRTYTAAGNVEVKLRATDPDGATNVATATIAAGNTPPVVTMGPSTLSLFKVGDAIAFSAQATDAESGVLPASAFSWKYILHHCAVSNPNDCHEHFLQDLPGVTGGTVTAPDHEYPMYLELRVTVTDGTLSTVASRIVNPDTTTWSFTSAPSGLQLAVYGATATTPFTRTVVKGAASTVSAPTPQTLGNVQYVFSSWSDNGAQTHAVSSAGPLDLTAGFGVSAPGNTFAVNFAGGAITVGGVNFVDYATALTQGMIVTNAQTFSTASYPFPFDPAADAGTQALLKSGIFRRAPPNGQGFLVKKPVANGTYDVSFHCIENFNSNARNIDITVEGAKVAASVCMLPLGTWQVRGPYRVTVTDGELTVAVTRVTKGDPFLTAMKVVAVPPPPPLAVNLGGGPATSGGVDYLDHSIALAQGLAVSDAQSWSAASYAFPLNPSADTGTQALLKSGVYRHAPPDGQGFQMTRSVANGTYDVSFHCIENHKSNARDMAIAIEGVQVAANVCSQPLGSWKLLGPYRVDVADGQLNIAVTRVGKGDPFLSAIKVVAISNP